MRLKCFPLLIVFISVFTLFESCRKTEKVPEKDEMTTNLKKQDRFYNDYSSTDPHIIKLNAYFNRIDKGNDFVKLTIEKVGYPIWNKTQIVRTAARNGRGLADSITFSYIPFS